MSFDDLFDDLLEENPTANEEIIDNKNPNWLFPILGYKSSIKAPFENGTGFFINSNGYFVTAGHILNNEELVYKAVVNNEELNFEILSKEYICKEQQYPPLCRDLAICKIAIKKNIDCYLDSKSPNNQPVSISGFSRHLIYGVQINPVKHGNLYLQHDCVIDEKISYQRFNDYRPVCTNTRSLKLKDGIKYDGLSGGPVYNEKCIYGMFIGNEYILSEYIIEKLNQLKIPFNTIK